MKRSQATGDRLPMSLLDRLSVTPPSRSGGGVPPRAERPHSDPRTALLRDLEWLLNTTCLEESRELSEWTHVRRSVLNFGVPEMSGKWLSDLDRGRAERALQKVIEQFEPRLKPGSVRVTAEVDRNGYENRSLRLHIEADCIDTFDADSIAFTVDVDVETGRIRDTLL